jgi:hypothetical protein
MIQGYRISKGTAAFIECSMLLDDLFSKVLNALELRYGEKVAENHIKEGYFPKVKELQKYIDDYIVTSISENIRENNPTEI